MLTVPQIKTHLNELLAKLSTDVPDSMCEGFFQPNDIAQPYVCIKNDKYHLKVRERGYLFEDWSTSNVDEIIYRIVNDITFHLAGNYELDHRVERQDSRILRFEMWLKYMSEFRNEEWTKRLENEIEDTLKQTPYSD